MRLFFALCVLLLAASAPAKPWNGIDPGVSKRDEVVKKFGDPSRTVTSDGKEVLAYFGKQAIKGTQQTQFRIDPATQRVERIDVFPGPIVDRDAVESTYGPPCPTSGPAPQAACYYKKLTDDFRTYFLYPRLGLAVFYNEDAKTVHSLIFQTMQATGGQKTLAPGTSSAGGSTAAGASVSADAGASR